MIEACTRSRRWRCRSAPTCRDERLERVRRRRAAPEHAAPVRQPVAAAAPRDSCRADARRLDPSARRSERRLGDDEDDIDVVDAIDPDLFPIFEEEATELLPQLGGALRQWARTARQPQRRATTCCARCTRSRAVPGWPARCAWANSPTAWSRRSSACGSRARGRADVEPLLHALRRACRPPSTRCVPPAAARPRPSAGRRPRRASRSAPRQPRPRRVAAADAATAAPSPCRGSRAGARRAGRARRHHPWRRSARSPTRPCACARSCSTAWSTRPAR